MKSLKSTFILVLKVALLLQLSSSFVRRSFSAAGPHKKQFRIERSQETNTDQDINKMSSGESMSIRDVVAADVANLKKVVDSSDLFPPEMLDEMISGYLAGTEDCLWLTADNPDPTLIAYCAPEKMTEGTWNLYLIAVHESMQGTGIGTKAVKYLEEQLVAKKGCRILLVETSGLPEFGRLCCHLLSS